MSDEEKTNCYRIGLAFIGIAVNNKTAEMLWRFSDKFREAKGKMNIMDALQIESYVESQEKQRQRIPKATEAKTE